ncbi:MAG: spermidine synthase [Betaproteobacteria bacterium]|nr:spermidine synthase [Betaproteobacteria bacterium]
MTTLAEPLQSLIAPRSVFFLLFTVSGFAGLIYESVWSHYLKLFLGHAAYAQTLVLVLFMGGMAVGAWLCSRLSSRWRNLLRGYAVAELLIGIAALVFHPLFVATTGVAYDSLLPGAHAATGSEAVTGLLKWVLAGLLILPQSILLGMTFPLMSAGIIRRHPRAPGETLALLYFTNSLGAALGVLAGGFILTDKLGLPGTMQVAGLINLALALGVWWLAPGRDDANTIRAAGASPGRAAAEHASDGEHPPHQAPAVTAPSYGLLLAIAALTGAASFVYEIGWIRMLSLVLGASTHSFELMLSSFILGLACGGLWIRGRIDRIVDPVRFLALVQVAMGLLALGTLPLYGEMFPLMQSVMKALAKTDSGYLMYLMSSHGFALAIMFPATFCTGMTLPLITYTLLRSGHGEKTIGAVYAANTLGSIAGVIAAAHLGMPLLGLKGLISAGAALDVALGLVLLWRLGHALGAPHAGERSSGHAAARHPRFGVPLAATLLSATAFAGVLWIVQLDAHRMASGVFRRGDLYTEKDANLIYYKDGKTTSVALMDFQDDRSLRTNGKSDGAINMGSGPIVSDEITMTLTGALPLAFRPETTEAAVIGIGTGLTTHTLLANPALLRVDTVEIEPYMAEASRRFAPFNANAYADPRSNIVFDDAKTYFSTHNRRYDLIVSEPSNPWVSGVSSLFTGEFYQLARRYLKPQGVLVQWFQMYEIDISLVASVLQALGNNFPDYVIYAATDSDLLIVAGDPETLARPIADITAMPGVSRELSRVHLLTLGDIEIRRIGGKKALAPFFASFGVPANSDYYPYLDLNAARYRFLQRSAGDFITLGTSGIPVLAMLEGRDGASRVAPSLAGEDYFEKVALTRRAQYARDFLLRREGVDPLGIPRTLQKDLEITRLRLLECREPERFDIWFHSLYQVARMVNPLLSRDAGRELWARIARSPCLAGLETQQRRWIELFAAVGRRDAAAMARLAEALLPERSDLPAGHRQYLVAAGMSGYLADGQHGKALAMWNRHAAEVHDPADLTLRLLHAHARVPSRDEH